MGSMDCKKVKREKNASLTKPGELQHFAGIEYLYRRDGHWLISDKIGLHEAGLQNQGEDVIRCPYRFRTSWEYADVERPGWQV